MSDAAIPYTAGTAPPRIPVPEGATDCHHHVYADSAAAWPGTRPHAPASIADHARLMRRLGVTRQVLVQPSTYGYDNRLHLAALAEAGPRARMVAVVPPDAPPAALRAMAAQGVVGARANIISGVPLALTDIEALARTLGTVGWHLQLFVTTAMIAELAPVLRAAPCDIVFDHFAQLPLRNWQADPAWPVVLDLLASGRGWVKLSSPYSLDEADPLAAADLARALVAAAPERLVWGTNWPHPNARTLPDDAALLDALAAWVPDDATRRAILVDNPAKLYGFR